MLKRERTKKELQPGYRAVKIAFGITVRESERLSRVASAFDRSRADYVREVVMEQMRKHEEDLGFARREKRRRIEGETET